MDNEPFEQQDCLQRVEAARGHTYPCSDKDIPIRMNIKDSELSQKNRDSELSQKNRDIYPASNFIIDIPTDFIASNQLNLIFDAKVRKSSTVMDIDFSPDDIIQEEEDGKPSLT